MQTLIQISGLALALAAGWIDWRSRRIPNWLTVTGFTAGLALNCFVAHWHGMEASLEGAGLALGLLLPLVLLRTLGAGDWKLVGALGAFWGPGAILSVLLVSVFVAGIMAAVEVVRLKRVKETLRNMVILVHGVFTFGVRPGSPISLDQPGVLAIPFGAAVAFGALLIFGGGCLGQASHALKAWLL
ncbi:MAG TPA: A24 family peptidase [Terriglobia bacterium]|nr:A24 family peptidase [Terriglobia bacterium]